MYSHLHPFLNLLQVSRVLLLQHQVHSSVSNESVSQVEEHLHLQVLQPLSPLRLLLLGAEHDPVGAVCRQETKRKKTRRQVVVSGSQ